jgi:hypothetical protein
MALIDSLYPRILAMRDALTGIRAGDTYQTDLGARVELAPPAEESPPAQIYLDREIRAESDADRVSLELSWVALIPGAPGAQLAAALQAQAEMLHALRPVCGGTIARGAITTREVGSNYAVARVTVILTAAEPQE